jgi:hypothetical protein
VPTLPGEYETNTHQYSPRKTKLSLKLKIGDEVITEEGFIFAEATFISQ